jgi:hypothetical protein
VLEYRARYHRMHTSDPDLLQGRIASDRRSIADLLEESPSLSDYPVAQLADAYADARSFVAILIGRSSHSLPEACPWTLDEILTDDDAPNTETIAAMQRLKKLPAE